MSKCLSCGSPYSGTDSDHLLQCIFSVEEAATLAFIKYIMGADGLEVSEVRQTHVPIADTFILQLGCRAPDVVIQDFL
ncbi:hypothetical protein SUGI_0978940 [Cryptomeria japonica]|nr:hypothetical protein SUGI_0978940 [Cryptomeria japonica]